MEEHVKKLIAKWPWLAMILAMMFAVAPGSVLAAFDGCPVLSASGAESNCSACHYTGAVSIQGDLELGQFSAAVNQGGDALRVCEDVNPNAISGHCMFIDSAHSLPMAAPENFSLVKTRNALTATQTFSDALRSQGGDFAQLVDASAIQIGSGTTYIPGHTHFAIPGGGLNLMA